MLLTIEIKVKMNRGNLGYYNKKMNRKFKIDDEVLIPIDKIPKSSYFDVGVMCDICSMEKETTYRNYNDCLKYGFYSCQKCKHTKRRMTNKIKYDDENFTNIKKRKETMISKHGCYFNNNEKSKKTVKDKYGVCNISQLDSIKCKKKETTLLNWGVDNPTYIKDNKFIYTQDGYIEYNKVDKYHKIKCGVGHEFNITTNLFYSRYYRGSTICTTCNHINKLTSEGENEVYDLINDNYDGRIIQSYRDVLEIDIYLPDLNIGFEFNGLYWHSEEHKNKNYHLHKTEHFKERGIRIIHIWEDDWLKRREIMKSIILNKVKKSNRIFARKCKACEINNITEVKDFLNTNHIQGFNNNIKKSIGLYYNGELVSIMSFNDIEGRKRMKNGFNITRFCNKLNTSVIGGASKIISLFKSKYRYDYMISYADYSLSDGGLYKSIGFELVNKSYPDYTYIVGGVRKHKSNYKKDKLGIKGKSITESEFMKNIGIYRIYDCGKLKFIMNF